MSAQQFKRTKKAKESRTTEQQKCRGGTRKQAQNIKPNPAGEVKYRGGSIDLERLPFQVARISGIEQEPQCDKG